MDREHSGFPIEAAIFDMDGTIVDSMGVWHDVGARYLMRRGIEPEPNLGDKLFTMTSVTCAEYMNATYHLNMGTEELAKALSEEMREFYTNEVELREGARELLDSLASKDIPMVIVTSTDGYLVEIVLKRLGLESYFQGVYSSGDLKMTKSEPEIFFLAAEKLGRDPEKTFVFEDGLYAVKTANAAGFRTLGIADEISKGDQPELKVKTDLYVEELTEIILIETENEICITKS